MIEMAIVAIVEFANKPGHAAGWRSREPRERRLQP
jgi:hypothetical protein